MDSVFHRYSLLHINFSFVIRERECFVSACNSRKAAR